MHSTKANKQTRGQGADPAFPRLLGERLCINYVNTIDGPLGRNPQDFLTDYRALVRWERHAGILSDEETERLEAAAAQRPDDAHEVFTGALALRATLYRIFVSIATGAPPDAAALATLKQVYIQMLEYADLGWDANRYVWRQQRDDTRLARVLWPIVRSAVEVLASAEVGRVKQCPGCDDCGWLFLDTSKNGTRQWCSMEGCGSRAKMRRQYARKRTATPSDP